MDNFIPCDCEKSISFKIFVFVKSYWRVTIKSIVGGTQFTGTSSKPIKSCQNYITSSPFRDSIVWYNTPLFRSALVDTGPNWVTHTVVLIANPIQENVYLRPTFIGSLVNMTSLSLPLANKYRYNWLISIWSRYVVIAGIITWARVRRSIVWNFLHSYGLMTPLRVGSKLFVWVAESQNIYMTE